MPAQKHTGYTDDALLQKYREGYDSYWLGILLERYTLLLLGVGMKYLREKEASMDAVQQVFLKAIVHLPSGEIANFKGWLYVLMRNHCLQVLRDRKMHLPGEVLDYVADPSAVHTEPAENSSYSSEEMLAALEQLHETQRDCIILFYLKKQTYQQIMEHTGYSFQQVKSFIQNGKRNLKIILMKKPGARPL